MSSNNQTFYRFKEFRLDAAERMLLRGTSSISLTPKAFDVLEILVERNGRLVEKDELLKLVWEDTFVEESNIARVVHSLRKILGEDAENKFIETVPKKGYRFVAEVEKINETNGFSLNGNHSHEIFENPQATKKIESVESEKFETTNKNRTKFAAFAAIFIFVFAVAGIWLYGNFRSKTDATKVPPQSRSIAVLPLKPLNSDARDSIYELGIAESLILKLSSAKDLTVRPLSATRKYQQLDQNPTDAGREQQVDLVLSSNYQLVNGKIRVTSQLIEVKSGNVEETFKTEKDSVDIFQMQDALANEIGSNLLTKLGNRENLLTISRITSNEEAYRLYLQAAFVFDQWNKTEMGTAIEYLERAVKLDPNFAEAYVYLGYAYRFTPGKYSGAPQEQFAKSKAAIEKALALKPNLAEAFAVSGMLKSSYESDFAGAEKDFKHALEINPSSPMALALYGNFLTIPGRFDEAIALNKKAQEIEPAAITHKINYGMLLYYSCRYNEAVTYFKKLVDEDKNFSYAYFWLWLLYDLQNDETQAFDWFIKYQTQIKAPPELIKIFQNTYQNSGWKAVMRELIAQDEKKVVAENVPALYYGIACYYARLGNKDKAFENLEIVWRERLSTITLLKVDPYLDPLHSDPRFENLVKRVGLN